MPQRANTTLPRATPQLHAVVDAAKRVADMRECVNALLELLADARCDRHWHAQVRARVVELLRLYPVREARL